VGRRAERATRLREDHAENFNTNEWRCTRKIVPAETHRSLTNEVENGRAPHQRRMQDKKIKHGYQPDVTNCRLGFTRLATVPTGKNMKVYSLRDLVQRSLVFNTATLRWHIRARQFHNRSYCHQSPSPVRTKKS
jgi:hypothetical protein